MSDSGVAGRHVCVLVRDIEATAAALGRSAGMDFESPRTLPVRLRVSGCESDVDVTFAYSIDRSTELLQAIPGDGPLGDALGFGFHHFGVRADGRIQETVERELSSGAVIECELLLGSALLAVFFKPTPARPFRFEVVSAPVPAAAMDLAEKTGP